MQVTGATVDSCFVLVRTHQHGTALQPQAMKLQGRVQRTALRLISYRIIGTKKGKKILSLAENPNPSKIHQNLGLTELRVIKE